MKKFRELVEASETMVFAYGRFNPPTTGHEKLIEKVVSVAGSNDYRIYPSHTQNPKRDPLPQALKTAYMRKMFKKYARKIVVSKSRNAIEIAVELYDLGYKNLIMIAGSDRVKVFDAMLSQYNGGEGKRHGYYKFDSIKIVSAGERDPDSEGVEGMSASKMRAAASDGNYDEFIKGLPSGFSDSKKLYRDVRKHMGIREEKDMGDMTDFESMRDDYLTGKIWNVGDIVEANGVIGEVVRKGTNYLSYMAADSKVYKAWLHEIELDEGVNIRGLRKDFNTYILVYDEPIKGPSTPETFKKMKARTQEIDKTGIFDGLPQNYGTDGTKILHYSKKSLEDVKKAVARKTVKDVVHYKPGLFGVKLRLKSEIEVNERNYAKEYANYQGKPEQITRRSSRNKARRVMGDKTKIGMDVGHKDNNPMNNDPSNLRNEDPSKNRREPRLRDKTEIDENWWKDLWSKISQITHPRGWDVIVKRYVDGMKNPENRKHPSMWANDVANEYNVRGVDGRSLVQYINKLVSKGKLPKELKAEFEPMEETMSFKDFVDHINNK